MQFCVYLEQRDAAAFLMDHAMVWQAEGFVQHTHSNPAFTTDTRGKIFCLRFTKPGAWTRFIQIHHEDK